MAHRKWDLIVNDTKNNRKRIFEFTSKLDYENQLSKVKQDFTIIQENTITTLDVELAPTIFDEGAEVDGGNEAPKDERGWENTFIQIMGGKSDGDS